VSNRYKKSEALLKRAELTIPLGSQTFSKSKTQLPRGVSPFFASKAKGAYMWDVDGNKYIDFVSGLAAITIGYNNKHITRAVKNQLKKGTIFSLPHELEFKVAEKICEMVPCAEQVRFGKNGSDATSGAIRLARAFTKKDHVLVCGYHGWQDWYIGSTTRDDGVPKATKDLTHKFSYNDIDSLTEKIKKFSGNIAAVILEPVNIAPPKDNFLQKVKELTHNEGAVLVFDETITGFRYANGGAQAFFGVTPDLATFGKGLANGYPVSAIAGKKEIMALMEDIFFSFTFGGEALSLAAAYATLSLLQKKPILQKINEQGAYLIMKLNDLISQYDAQEFASVEGYPCWSFFVLKPANWATAEELKTLFMQIMFEKGIYTLGTHNLSYAHSKKDIDKLLAAYETFFGILKSVKAKESIKGFLKAKPLVPLFKVR
jgi:glutamate-1-semialdehyde 2,1-aminomutase